MANPEGRHAVTGAYGYSGKYIARRLLVQGKSVFTLTNSPQREHAFGNQVPAVPYNFEQPAELARSLENVAVLYNTYWVRFNHRLFRHADAVRNTRRLFTAARQAGVERVVHISITNPALDSHLEYFRGKAELEEALRDTGLSYAILRPAVLFGEEDILINNIAWALRHLPVFGVFGDGEYRLQPIYVDDLAALAVKLGSQREPVIIDAIGPETFTYRGLVNMIDQAIGTHRALFSVPPGLGYAAARLLGAWLGDVLLTRDEIEGLMAGLLYAEAPPTGQTRLTDWVQTHAHTLGRRYASELARRRDRQSAYR